MCETFGDARTAVLVGPGKRDLRLDLLRGVGQWMIFLDHIPENFLNWFTLRNYGFPTQWGGDEVMTLVEAAAVFFPHGPLTLSSLRGAATAGTLEIAKVAGKDLTTPRAIRKLVKPSCRAAKPSRHDWFREDDETWIILDRGRQIRTGCSRDDIDGAAKALEAYIGERHTSTIGATDPSVLAIADVLTAYEISKRPKDKSDERAWAQHDLLLIRLLDLNNFFGDKTVSELKAQLCRDFVDWSNGTANDNNRKAGIKPRNGTVSDQTARRRLEDLRAAVNAYHAEHTLSVVPKITLPPRAEGATPLADAQ